MLSPKDMLRASVLAFSVAVLVGCTGSSENHTLGEFNAKTVGATCTAVDSAGAEMSGVTGSNGMVSVISDLAKGLVTMTCTGGIYTDEATGATVNAPTLRAATNYTGGSLTLIATPLSEIAYALAVAASDTANMAVYNAKVATAFSLGDMDIMGTIPQDLNAGAVDSSDAGKMGLILAAIAQMGADANTDPTTTIGKLITDIGADNVLDTGVVSTAINNLQASGTGASINATNSTGAETAIVSDGGSSLVAPSITVSSGTLVATIGVAIADITVNASAGGAVDSYSISPDLAANTGLSFDTSTGTISGTPVTAATAADYTITATNTAGSDTATVNITVNTTLVAPSITLSSGTLVATVGAAIADITVDASAGGAVDSYSISPDLAANTGLSFDTSTGTISGTPVTAATTADYTITAINTAGSGTATVNITVNAANTDMVNMSAPTVAAGSNNRVALTLSGNANGTFDAGDFAIASSNAKTAPTISSVEFTDGDSSLVLVMNRNIASASAGNVAESFTVAFTKNASTANVNNMAATAITNNSDNQNCSDCVLDSNGCPF